MAACRCSNCNIDYPAHADLFGTAPCRRCEVCGEITGRFYDLQPMSDWQQRVKDAVGDKYRKKLEETEDDPIVALPKVKTSVRVEGGEMFVLMWDVFPTMSWRLKDGTLFQIGKQVFEVLGYIEKRREYHVRPFSTELTEDDLAKLAGP